ncbi:hypothetical protein MVEN_02538700 [Mycena venus]|uniref:Uncharacterized protein n=1 Tax=Mycena venus TaxID=2733690 RepID=A0A8H6WRR3_9AGAR|nr:hypothetical protein MVEN_02538700 [Mycena venus]
MALTQYPLDKTFLVAAWLESLCYGAFFVVFFIGVYIHFGFHKGQNTHNKVMFWISVLMFLISTLHLALDVFRLIRGFVDFRLAPGGPVGYIGDISRWDHIFKDTLYITQSMVGDAAAIYRCWTLWNRDYRVIALPVSLLGITIGSGYYVVDGLFPRESPDATIFDPRLGTFITLSYAVAVIQNVITTSLMSWRLWQGERRIGAHRMGESTLIPILRILVESAALYLLVEILLLAAYARNYNVQYIILETVTPIAGLTFSMITIRINLRSQKKLANTTTDTGGGSHAIQTIGSIPMRPIVIRRQVEQIDDIETRYGKEMTLDGPEP